MWRTALYKCANVSTPVPPASFLCAASGDPLQLPAVKLINVSTNMGPYMERAWVDTLFC